MQRIFLSVFQFSSFHNLVAEFQLPSSISTRHIFQVFRRIQFLRRFYRLRPILRRNGLQRLRADRPIAFYCLSYLSKDSDRSDCSEQIARIYESIHERLRTDTHWPNNTDERRHHSLLFTVLDSSFHSICHRYSIISDDFCPLDCPCHLSFYLLFYISFYLCVSVCPPHVSFRHPLPCLSFIILPCPFVSFSCPCLVFLLSFSCPSIALLAIHPLLLMKLFCQ